MYSVFMSLTQFWTWFQIEHWAVFPLSDTAVAGPRCGESSHKEHGQYQARLLLALRVWEEVAWGHWWAGSALPFAAPGCDLWGLSQSTSWAVSVNRAQERMWDTRSFLVCGFNYTSLAGIKNLIHSWEERRKIQEKVRAEVRVYHMETSCNAK